MIQKFNELFSDTVESKETIGKLREERKKLMSDMVEIRKKIKSLESGLFSLLTK